jgi:hypothetical protein
MHETKAGKPSILAASLAAVLACLALSGCDRMLRNERADEIDRFLSTRNHDSTKRSEEIDQVLGVRKNDTKKNDATGRVPGVSTPSP